MEILNAARRAVPAVDYALGAAGVAAAGAIVIGLLGKGRASIIIVGGMLVAMMLLFVFARLVSSQNPAITNAGVVLLWVITLFFSTFLVFTTTAVAFEWPSAWAAVLGLERRTPSESPMQRLANKINYSDVATNQDAISSLVAMAMVSNDTKDREQIVTVLKEKLKHPPVTDFDLVSRGVKKTLLEGIVKIRSHDLRKDFIDNPLSDMDLVGIDLRNVNGQGIKFTRSFLIGSQLQGGDFRGADFSYSFLRNVRFENTNLAGAAFAEADWFNARELTREQVRLVERKGVKVCPSRADGNYSKERFIEFANSKYGVPYDGWSEEEQIETSKYWAEYMRPGGICDFVKSIH